MLLFFNTKIILYWVQPINKVVIVSGEHQRASAIHAKSTVPSRMRDTHKQTIKYLLLKTHIEEIELKSTE